MDFVSCAGIGAAERQRAVEEDAGLRNVKGGRGESQRAASVIQDGTTAGSGGSAGSTDTQVSIRAIASTGINQNAIVIVPAEVNAGIGTERAVDATIRDGGDANSSLIEEKSTAEVTGSRQHPFARASLGQLGIATYARVVVDGAREGIVARVATTEVDESSGSAGAGSAEA